MDYQQFSTLSDAVDAAASRCDRWRFASSDELYDVESLPGIAQIHDDENPTDEDSFYVVSGRGAIGFTEDCGESIDWLFIPLDGTDEDLPASLTATNVNFCTQCGSRVTPGTRFCAACGAKLN